MEVVNMSPYNSGGPRNYDYDKEWDDFEDDYDPYDDDDDEDYDMWDDEEEYDED